MASEGSAHVRRSNFVQPVFARPVVDALLAEFPRWPGSLKSQWIFFALHKGELQQYLDGREIIETAVSRESEALEEWLKRCQTAAEAALSALQASEFIATGRVYGLSDGSPAGAFHERQRRELGSEGPARGYCSRVDCGLLGQSKRLRTVFSERIL